MQTKFIEASQGAGLTNWGKFCVARWTAEEWQARSALPGAEGHRLLAGRGWDEKHIWVLDLQTGEGACFLPGGLASADLNKHQVWVCPMYEPFLSWLYAQDLSDLDALPSYVELPDAQFEMAGYRRGGPQAADTPT